MFESIQIRSANVNNLKNIDLDIPLNKITCLCGPSGSGKSSLAFHTLYNESKRRFLNSFPTYLKFFSDRPAPVEVESIHPVLPCFALAQINPIIGARSAVADVMGLSQMLQELFASHSVELCPTHGIELEYQELSLQIKKQLPDLDEKDTVYLCCNASDFQRHFGHLPFPPRSIKEEGEEFFIQDFSPSDTYWELSRFREKHIEMLDKKIDFLLQGPLQSLYAFVERGRDKSIEMLPISISKKQMCPKQDYVSKGRPAPSSFSAYNALGACSYCQGHGATLEYARHKMMHLNLSINEGGLRLLEYKRFLVYKELFLAEIKKKKISLNSPIETLPEAFFTYFYEGIGRYPGLTKLTKWLESKRYKAPVRIFIRSLQEEVECRHCHGSRLTEDVRHFSISPNMPSYQDLWTLDITELNSYLKRCHTFYRPSPLLNKALKRMSGLLDVASAIGLGHLQLLRKTKTLSAGEYQRLLMLKHLAYQGTDALFIFDEPSLGLSDKACKSVFKALSKLVEQGNTVLLVEHSSYFITQSDYVVALGPKAGLYGGEIIFRGKGSEYLDLIKRELDLPQRKKVSKSSSIKLKSPQIFNHRYKDIEIKKEQLNWVTGESGSGKSACYLHILGNFLAKQNLGSTVSSVYGDFKSFQGDIHFSDVIVVNSQLNRFTSRSTVGSLTGLASMVRKHFLKLPQAISMGLKDGHLSSNSKLGQCPVCEGQGVKVIEMQFLEDIVLECEECGGKKIKNRFANLSDGKMSVYESYNKPLNEVIERIKLTPKYQRLWDAMLLLNLGHLSLDRSVNSLSGGEKQRLYLLSKISGQLINACIIAENLSFGLSGYEVSLLMHLLNRLIEAKNTIVLIDQNQLFVEIAQHKIVL